MVEERGMAQHFESVDEYIAQFPGDVQDILQEVRRRCHAAVPGSGEMRTAVECVRRRELEYSGSASPYAVGTPVRQPRA